MTTKLKLELNSDPHEIELFNDFIREENLAGLITEIERKESESGSMSAESFMPIINLILGSTVVAAGVKGLFEVIKQWFEHKIKNLESEKEIAKIKSEERKVTFSKVKENGITETMSMSLFNEEERSKFLDFFSK